MADELLLLIRSIVAGDVSDVRRRLATDPALATACAQTGAARQSPIPFFFTSIRHYLYGGDTALHMASAACEPEIAQLLVTCGADVQARNRLGAMPLHYAADTNHRDPAAQARTISCLLSAGADPDASNRLGVTALHRAVRTRSASAVKALLDGGADARKKNRNGSAPLHLAVQTTGKSGSGSVRARQAQAEIIRLLMNAGARLTDRDARGRTVRQAARPEWLAGVLSGS